MSKIISLIIIFSNKIRINTMVLSEKALKNAFTAPILLIVLLKWTEFIEELVSLTNK